MKTFLEGFGHGGIVIYHLDTLFSLSVLSALDTPLE